MRVFEIAKTRAFCRENAHFAAKTRIAPQVAPPHPRGIFGALNTIPGIPGRNAAPGTTRAEQSARPNGGRALIRHPRCHCAAKLDFAAGFGARCSQRCSPLLCLSAQRFRGRFRRRNARANYPEPGFGRQNGILRGNRWRHRVPRHRFALFATAAPKLENAMTREIAFGNADFEIYTDMHSPTL